MIVKNMEKRIQNDLMAAMKAKDEVRAQTLRSVKAAILNEKSNGVYRTDGSRYH